MKVIGNVCARALDSHIYNLPKIIPISKDDTTWNDHFKLEDAVDPIRNGNKIDLFVNMSNTSLQKEIENSKAGEKFVLENQFKYGLALIALAMYYDRTELPKKESHTDESTRIDETDENVFEEIKNATRGAAIVILPLINNLNAIARSLAKKS